jgi:hypothetical protein
MPNIVGMKNRGSAKSLLHDVSEVVQVADVVALELEPSPTLLAEPQRACRCRMAAPASTAALPCSVISSAVTGRPGDIDGVCTDPLSAQEMMVFFERFTTSLLVPMSLSTHGSDVGGEPL